MEMNLHEICRRGRLGATNQKYPAPRIIRQVANSDRRSNKFSRDGAGLNLPTAPVHGAKEIAQKRSSLLS
jgi:hypothetical protein